MPSQHIGTFLTTKELQKVEDACKKAGITRYKLFKDALREKCEAILKEEVEHVGKGEGKSESGNTEKGTSTTERRNSELEELNFT